MRHHLEPARELRPVDEVGDVAGRKIFHERVRTAAALIEAGVEHDILEPRHLVGAKGERPINAHLHAGPAVLVVRGGHNRHARHVELELRKVRHRRERQPDIMHLAARRHEPGDQRRLHRCRVGAKIVAGDDTRLDPELADQRAEPEPQRLHPHEVDLFPQKPARVVFAKTGDFDQRLRFIGIGVGAKRGLRLGKHRQSLTTSGMELFRADSPAQAAGKAG